MRLALLTYGTQGDVQPFIALARGLQQAGHTVQLAAPGRFGSQAALYEIPFIPLPGDPGEFARILVDRTGKNPLKMISALRDFVFPLAGEVAAGFRSACQEADAVVHTFLSTTGGHAFARQQGIPDISVQFFPVFAPTRAFPSPAMPALPLGGYYNLLTHVLVTFFYWRVGHLGVGLLKRTCPDFPDRLFWPFRESYRGITPLLFAFSPAVVPRPSDWGEHVFITGYWSQEDVDDWEPPERLTHFLSAGPAPLCVNFGSVVSRNAEGVYAIILKAIEKTNQRAVIICGWGNWQCMGESANVCIVDFAPHDWLFPRTQAVIHHGGAGTTASALRVGVPSIIIPFASDQPFWGRRVVRIGAGPDPIPVRQLSVERLSAAIQLVTQTAEFKQRSVEIGWQLGAENGIANAIAIIEAQVQRFDRK